jgi:hypothetical protein
MAVILKLKCPDCAETFKWPGEQKWPEFCPHCRAQMTTRGDDEICMPFIGRAQTKATDSVYRRMEAGSEVRAQAAADMLGVSAADVSDLKINNLRDTRYGEVAHVPVSNDVSKLMDATPDATGFQSAGVQFSGNVQTGPFPNTGAKFQTELRKFHASEKGAGWGAMSDNPATEVLNPNYRRRA